MNSERHYHIRWSKLDWKPFPTSKEACEVAEQIKKLNESYVIEECDDACESCAEFKAKAGSYFFERRRDHAA